ncbi:hypothetical protein, partial [Clostridium gasigenes]|uniref:hypothetical protein n=1 Tax=Clostridium gasigenes TaxID=94869 RepID=UPI001A9B6657
MKKNSTSVEKIIKDVDYIVRRFKEVDSRCANRVKSIGQGYKIQASISKIGNSLMSMGNNVVGGVTTFFQNGVSAIKSMCSSVSTWFGEHPVVGNIISGVLNGLAIVGCGLAIVAEAPVIAVVGAVVGIALAANSLIDDGVKIYNNINNGNNSGLNLIKDGLKWATGDKAGEAIYTAVNVID